MTAARAEHNEDCMLMIEWYEAVRADYYCGWNRYLCLRIQNTYYIGWKWIYSYFAIIKMFFSSYILPSSEYFRTVMSVQCHECVKQRIHAPMLGNGLSQI
jgi:hypothetical protein